MKPALERGYYGHAEKVVEFEGALAHFLGVEAWQVICVSSGTAALHLAVEVTGRAGRPDVLVPSLTFAASFQAVVAGGGCPVACDVTRGGLNIDPVDVERRITDRIGAIDRGDQCIVGVNRWTDGLPSPLVSGQDGGLFAVNPDATQEALAALTRTVWQLLSEIEQLSEERVALSCCGP